MSKVNEYRRKSARIIRLARENLQYLLTRAQQRSDPDSDEIDTLLLIIEYVDKCGTDATIRNHNIEELLMDASRLRRQRDEEINARQALHRWTEQLQAELDNYRAQYPNPVPKPPVRPASNEPTEYFQQTLPFMDKPSARNNPSPKP